MGFTFDVWSTFAIVVLMISLCVGSITAYYWWRNYLVLLKWCQNIPQFKQIPIVTYYQTLIKVCRSENPSVIWLQIVHGFCKMFSSEDLFMFWLGARPMIVFCKAEAVEVLVSSFSAISKSPEYNFLKPWIRTGLLTSTDEKWRKHRKLLTPSFHFQILENFIPVFNEEAEILTKKLELEVAKSSTDIKPIITMCTLDIICRTAMGVNLNIQSGNREDYVQSVHEMGDAFFYRMPRPWLWFDPVFFYLSQTGWKYRKNLKNLHGFTKKVIREKKLYMINQRANENDKPSRKKKAFLECLLECHLKDESFTEENVREEVDTFMFEGHDTTSSALTWTLFEIGHHPDVQEKIFQELDYIFQSDYERFIDSEDMKHMKYLECVIKESLRLYPPVFAMGRQIKEKIQIGNYTLMPGCTCLLFPYALHRNPEVFPNPEIFNPDRFLPENCSNRHPYAYIPFSAGPRNCIGQRFALLELKTVLAYILRKFKLTSVDPHDKINVTLGLILKSAEPIRIKFSLRKPEDYYEVTHVEKN